MPKFTTDNSKETQTEKIFWGRIPVVQAHSFLRFSKKNLTQKVIHKFKYKNRQAIGEILGRFYGSHLKGRFFNSVDVIIPVPLHPIKLEKRGFNQSEFFAMGLARALNKPIITEALSRRIHSTTQTRKRRYERWKNVEEIFKLNDPEAVRGKHILLVDDIVTTGATLEAASIVLQKAGDVKISIATLAITEDA
ncbi:MAG: ComF family protein [Bacteroidota bacterium]